MLQREAADLLDELSASIADKVAMIEASRAERAEMARVIASMHASINSMKVTEKHLMYEVEQQKVKAAGLAKIVKRAGAYEVSDHALVRYLERVKGVDVPALRKEAAGWACGKDRAIIHNGALVTILPDQTADMSAEAQFARAPDAER